MQAPFSLFLALRYLRPKRTFVSVITLISIAGVALGVLMLIVVISVMTGFDHELRRKILGFDAHVLITSEGVLQRLARAGCAGQEAAACAGDSAVCAGAGDCRIPGQAAGAEDPRHRPRARAEGDGSQEGGEGDGKLDLSTDEQGNSNKTVIGRELANELGVGVGDVITVYSPGNLSELVEAINRAKTDDKNKKSLDELQQMILPADLTVTGIFESGRFIYDAEFLLVPLHIGQELYGLGDALHGLSLRTDDPYQVGVVKEELEKIVTPQTQVLTWIDLNKQFFDALNMERNMMFIIVSVIVIVAAFGIMNTLITVTVQKKREIGIMKALGATSGQVVSIFLIQGMIVGVIGNAVGLGLGIFLVRWRNEAKDLLAGLLHIEIFPASIYQLSQIPAETVPGDVLKICLSAFVIVSLAALLPAYFAARLDPVKALRYE